MSKAPTKTRAAVGQAPSQAKAKFLTGLDQRPTMEVPDNMSAKQLQDMSFKVEIDFHDRLKLASLRSRMSMKDIFKEAVDEWISRKWPKG
ncbi:hypothetical protein NKH72_22435 [Mesorhizobium sp. M0955]|uniref:hypothetical protein n=1 Tax=Mesorhizobium sp. M0955 TaxID=2957033 RepID=UPI003335E47F